MIEVRADDPWLQDRLQAWLDAMELTPPGAPVLEVRLDPPSYPALDREPIFRQPEITYHAGAVDGEGIRIAWEHAPAVASIPSNRPHALVWMSREAVEELARCCRFFLSAVLIMLLRRVGWHHVHAGTWIDPRGRGWLFAGDWKVGKSTTVALLASRGWTVGGDDVVFLAREGEGVTTVARRGAIALREEGRELLRLSGGVFHTDRGKSLFTPEELGGRWIGKIRPSVLVFPSIGEAETLIHPVRPAEVLAELVRWSAWVALEPDLAQEHLDLLAALGGQARSYRMTLGRDLFTNPERLLELIP